jgi:hypothetical protein
MSLRTDYTNATAAADTHPAAHNDANAQVNAHAEQIAANAAAIARLPRGRVALIDITPQSILQGAPVTISTPALTLAGRNIRVTFSAFARATGGAVTMEVSLTVPGIAATQFLRVSLASGGAGSIAEANRVAVQASAPTGDGVVSITITNQTATNPIVITAPAQLIVDDMGAAS